MICSVSHRSKGAQTYAYTSTLKTFLNGLHYARDHPAPSAHLSDENFGNDYELPISSSGAPAQPGESTNEKSNNYRILVQVQKYVSRFYYDDQILSLKPLYS